MSTLADLQKRNLAQMEVASAPEIAPADTDVRESVSTEALTEVRKGAGTEASTPARKQARKAANTEGRKSASAAGHKSVGKEVSTDGEEASTDKLMDSVDAALTSREPLIGGVKATVDMSPELSTRAKRYLADHRGQNTRQVLIALFDAFLTAKGY